MPDCTEFDVDSGWYSSGGFHYMCGYVLFGWPSGFKGYPYVRGDYFAYYIAKAGWNKLTQKPVLTLWYSTEVCCRVTSPILEI